MIFFCLTSLKFLHFFFEFLLLHLEDYYIIYTIYKLFSIFSTYSIITFFVKL
jgi:hypothetical protein